MRSESKSHVNSVQISRDLIQISPDFCPSLVSAHEHLPRFLPKTCDILSKTHEISFKSCQISVQISRELNSNLEKTQVKSREISAYLVKFLVKAHEISVQISWYPIRISPDLSLNLKRAQHILWDFYPNLMRSCITCEICNQILWDLNQNLLITHRKSRQISVQILWELSPNLVGFHPNIARSQFTSCQISPTSHVVSSQTSWDLSRNFVRTQSKSHMMSFKSWQSLSRSRENSSKSHAFSS